MLLDKQIKYKDILIIVLLSLIGYKIVDNYEIILNFVDNFLSIISPFIYSAAFAYMLNPVMKIFERRFKLSRGIAILSTYLLITGLIIIGIMYVIPSLVDSIISITSDMPSYMDKLQGWIDSILKNGKISNVIKEIGLLDSISDLSTTLGSFLIDILQNLVSYLVSFATDLIKVTLGYIISIYVLIDKERIKKQFKVLLFLIFKGKIGGKLIEIISTYNKMVGVYIGIKAIDSLIIGVIAFLGLTIIDAPYAVLIALVVGLTNMISYFGPLVGEVIGAFIGIFESPLMALGIFVLLFMIQQFDAWFLDPKLVGNKVGVRPLILIFAVTVGGGFFGILGMLLASPTAATLKIFYTRKIEQLNINNSEKASLSEDKNKKVENE